MQIMTKEETSIRLHYVDIMFNWSNKEIVITIYFSSRCIRPRSLRSLLLRRGYDRSLGAIKRKIIYTTKQTPFLKSSNGHQDLNSIDRQMNDLIRSYEVNNLTRFSLEDTEDMVLIHKLPQYRVSQYLQPPASYQKESIDDLLEVMENLGLDFTDPAFSTYKFSRI